MILETMQSALTEAMKSKRKEDVETLRMLIASLSNEKIAKKGKLSDEDALQVLKREVKKRDEASIAFKSAGRTESAEKEEREKRFIETFLPEQLTDSELEEIIQDVIAGAGEEKQFGPLMQAVMSRTKGSADGSKVSRILKEKMS